MNILSRTYRPCSKTLDVAFFIIMLHCTIVSREHHDSSLKCVRMKDEGSCCSRGKVGRAQTPVLDRSWCEFRCCLGWCVLGQVI